VVRPRTLEQDQRHEAETENKLLEIEAEATANWPGNRDEASRPNIPTYPKTICTYL